MKIYLATWLEGNQGKTLTKVKAKTRLMSYYFLKNTTQGFVEEYVTTGLITKATK